MPTTLDVDWNAVRLLAIQVGVREAARQMGLGESAVMQRSSREGWVRDLPRSTPLPPTMRPQPVSGVSTPAECAIRAIRNDLAETRASHIRLSRRVSAALERRDDDELLADAGETLLKTAKHAALAGGWQEQTVQKVTVCLQSMSEADSVEVPVLQDAQDDTVIEI